MPSEVKTFLAGFIVGMVALTGILAITPNNVSDANKAIDECESTLPRDQHCKIIAVPEGE